MACILTFDDNLTTGVLTGSPSSSGVFEFVGYSTTLGGSYGPGGNFPTSSPAWGSSVDVSSVTPGFYKFKYKANVAPEDPCYGEIEFIIPVVQGTTDVPGDLSISLCSGDDPRNMFDDLGLYLPSGTNPVTITTSGGGFTSPGYSAGSGLDTATYDPSAETTFPISRTFTYEYEITTVGGYTNSDCGNCITKTVTLTYNVTDGFQTGTPTNKAVCNDGE